MLEGGPSTKMQVPRDERQGLCLTQQFVVLQLSVPLGVGFNVQILWVIVSLSLQCVNTVGNCFSFTSMREYCG